MTKGTFCLMLALVNVYISAFLENSGQRKFSLIVAAYCAVLAVWNFYDAAKGVK